MSARPAAVAAFALAALAFAFPAAAGVRAVDAPATLAVAAPAPIRCYATLQEYFAASGIPPTRYWLGVAGFWGVPRSSADSADPAPVIGLTPAACAAAGRLHEGVTIARAYAAFTVAHEIAHALGTGAEADADCRGAALLPTVAYALGLRGTASFAALRTTALRVSGYDPVPAACWLSS